MTETEKNRPAIVPAGVLLLLLLLCVVGGQRLPAGLFLAVARLCDAFYIVEISAPCLLGPVRIVAG